MFEITLVYNFDFEINLVDFFVFLCWIFLQVFNTVSPIFPI